MSETTTGKKSLKSNHKGSFSFILLRHPKYCTGKFANHVPFISYNDLTYKYIVRGRCEHELCEDVADDIIAEYDSIESLINDGWRMG